MLDAGRRARRPRRALPRERHRVPRGDARGVQAARRADQRQLPLRRGRAAVPASTTPTWSACSTTDEFAAAVEAIRADAARRSAGGSPSTTAPYDGADRPDEVGYEDALAVVAERAFGPGRATTPTCIYTGGTTGMPKGVVWRQEDAFFACIGGGDPMRLAGPVDEPAEVLDRIIDGTFVFLPVAPLMHAAGQWTSLSWLFAGGKVVLLPGLARPGSRCGSTDRATRASTCITVVGDRGGAAARRRVGRARPLRRVVAVLGRLGRRAADAVAQAPARRDPARTSAIVDGFGSSETGAQGSQRARGRRRRRRRRHARSRPTATRPWCSTRPRCTPVEPGSDVVGRVALRGHIPQGYYNDPEKTAADVRRGRRPALGAHRRHGHRRGRRHDHAARPRLGVHQHRAARRSSPRRSRRC